MRADKAKSISKVAETLVNNPLLSEREIAEETWLGNWTVNRAKQQLEQIGAKNEDIIQITDTDKKAIQLAQRIVIQSLEKHVELSEASGWLDLQEALKASWLAKESTARYSLFRGNATDEQWGLKWIDSIDIL